ncbi:MAG: FliM/FliN family flagellar motor switch protein [Acidimicrobiales bacterium]
MTKVRPIELADLAVSEVVEPIDEMVRNAAESVLQLATAMLQRPTTGLTRAIRADEKVGIGGRRWFASPSNPAFLVGLRDAEAVGLAELFLGAPASRPERPITPIEMKVLGSRLIAMLPPIAAALGQPVDESGALREAAPPQSRGWRFTTLEMTIEAVPYPLVLAVPQREDDESVSRPQVSVAATVGRVELPIVVAIPGVRISASELSELRVGDVIRCDWPEDEPVPAFVGPNIALTGRFSSGAKWVMFEIVTSRIGAAA